MAETPKPMSLEQIAEMFETIEVATDRAAKAVCAEFDRLTAALAESEARAARMERERDEARRAQIRCAFGSAGHVMARRPDAPYSEPVRCLTHKEVARVWGWGYLYPESECQTPECPPDHMGICEHDWALRRDNTFQCRKCGAVRPGGGRVDIATAVQGRPGMVGDGGGGFAEALRRLHPESEGGQ